MLIYHCCRLRAAVAIRAVEIEGGDAMLAVSAFECGATIHRFGCVTTICKRLQYTRFFASDVFALGQCPMAASHQNGQNPEVRCANDAPGQPWSVPNRTFRPFPRRIGNPHQTRVPTFPQRRPRRAAWPRQGPILPKSGASYT